jgi:hypothetical protein
MPQCMAAARKPRTEVIVSLGMERRFRTEEIRHDSVMRSAVKLVTLRVTTRRTICRSCRGPTRIFSVKIHSAFPTLLYGQCPFLLEENV